MLSIFCLMFVSLDIFVGGSKAILCINNAALSPDLKPRVRSLAKVNKAHFK
jgi:hypothetical protein